MNKNMRMRVMMPLVLMDLTSAACMVQRVARAKARRARPALALACPRWRAAAASWGSAKTWEASTSGPPLLSSPAAGPRCRCPRWWRCVGRNPSLAAAANARRAEMEVGRRRFTSLGLRGRRGSGHGRGACDVHGRPLPVSRRRARHGFGRERQRGRLGGRAHVCTLTLAVDLRFFPSCFIEYRLERRGMLRLSLSSSQAP